MNDASLHWPQRGFTPDAKGPLHGIRVLDLSRLVAGNMLSLQLADFGADVIKVEPYPAGDPLRAWTDAGVSAFWKVYARNKRSLALNFRAEGAAALLRRLMLASDAVIESFRPGTLEAMGLAPEQLLESNPKLIVVRIAGFGQTGPYSSKPGFGTLVEAMSGFASRNGHPDREPLLPPLALADMVAGLYGAFATTIALRAREQNGSGQVVDLSLLEPIVSILGPEAAAYALTGTPKPRVANGSTSVSPRNVYKTRDGGYIALSGSTQNMAERIFTAIGRPELINDPRYATNAERAKRRHEVDAIVGDWIGQRDRAEALAHFTRHGVTAAPIYDIADIHQDPHFKERGVYVSVPDRELGQIAMHDIIPRLSATPGALRRPAPALGADTREVLSELGLTAQEIAAALDAGIVVAGDVS